jgi:hypothetical protein
MAGASSCKFADAVEADEGSSMCADEAVLLHALLEELK